MKIVIGIIILAATLLLGVFATRAQSTDVNDYSRVFVYQGRIHMVDRTSIQHLPGERVVFWSVFLYGENVLFTSMEVNCLTARARVRATGIATDTGIITKNKLSSWFPRTDPIANRYIYVACH